MSEEIRLLASVVIYIAGIPLFWGRAVELMNKDDEVLAATSRAPDGVGRVVVKVIAGVMSLFWWMLMTWELAEMIWDYRPWGKEESE